MERRGHGGRARTQGEGVTTTSFADPVVATFGTKDVDSLLVVLLHGRGSNERDIVGLAGQQSRVRLLGRR